MATHNNITGDEIKSKSLSTEGRDNWDNIFGEKQTSYQWITKLAPGTVIYDPDGWRDGDGVTLETPITEEDFNQRFNRSTCLMMPHGVMT